MKKALIWVGIVVVGLLLLLNSPPVTRLVVNRLLPKLNQGLNGRLTVEGVSGSLLNSLQLRGVTLRDPEGQVVLQAERVDVAYSVWDLLHSKFTLGPLLLERPVVRLLKDHPGEQYSILRVFEQRADSVPAASKGVDLTIRDVTLRNGAIVATIWRQPAAPQQEQAQKLDTVQLQNVNLNLPLLHYSAGPSLPRAALLEIASASAFLSNPELELDKLDGDAQLHGDSIVITLRTIQLPSSRMSADAWLVTTPDRRRFDATARVDELLAGDVRSFISGADIPADWSFHGTLRTTSRSSGAVIVTSPDFRLTAAGGTVRGHVTVEGRDNEWNARNSRLDVAGVEVEQLLRAFHVPSNLRAQIDGVITADRQRGSADLQLTGAAGYTVRGPVNGHIHASGDASAMAFETRLGGSAGDVFLTGNAAMGKHLAVKDLRGDLHRFDLAAVDARMPRSNINAHLEGGVLFGSMPRAGSLRLFLDSSVVRGVPIDTAVIIVHADSGLLTADTLSIRAPGLRMRGSGTFGLYEDQSGDLTLTLDVPSLREVGPVLAAFTHDTVVALDGALQLAGTASGSLKRYTFDTKVLGHDLAMKGLHVDSLSARAVGTVDSLRFGAGIAVDSATVLNLGGRANRRTGGLSVSLDSLRIERGDARWNMLAERPVRAAGGKLTLDSVQLEREPGPGRLTVTGALPGKITVIAEQVPVADLLMKKNRDSLPDLEGTVTYADGAATGTLALATADRRPLLAEFSSRPFTAQLQADSLDVSLFAPLVPSVRSLGGRLDGNVTIGGAMDAPRLGGELRIAAGKASVPATGVAYHDLTATLTFSGDAVQVERMDVLAGKGHAAMRGNVKFARLDQPQLAVAVRTENFPVMNRRDFLEATATGDMRLSGSPAGAVLTGNARVNEGNAYLEKFMRSSGIDLSDPLYAQFVDTTVLHSASGDRGVAQSFMDSLRIDSISVDLGDNFWLKSPDASIQLEGRLTVHTARSGQETERAEKYNLEGTVRAVRGIYRMALAPGLSREFTIREGSIRYFGSPRKDAFLDLNAEHVVRTATGDEVRITAHIGGTLEKPTIQLASDVSPPLSETELISYLVFGAPTAQAFLGSEGDNSQHSTVFEKSAEQLVSVLSGKIESAVVSQLGLPIDYFRIKPGEVQSGLAGTELVLGMQVRILGYPSFLRASPRFCPREQLLSLDHIGIDLETRVTHQFGVAASIDPLQSCEAAMSGTAARPYQFGIDVFWEKR